MTLRNKLKDHFIKHGDLAACWLRQHCTDRPLATLNDTNSNVTLHISPFTVNMSDNAVSCILAQSYLNLMVPTKFIECVTPSDASETLISAKLHYVPSSKITPPSL